MSWPALAIGALLLGLAIGGTSAWKVQAYRWAAADGERAAAEAEAQRLQDRNADAAATRHEATRERVRVQHEVVYKEVERINEAENAAAVQCLSPAGLRLVEAAARGADPAGEPAPALPASAAAP